MAKNHSLPWIIFALLFCGVFVCAWLIWSQYSHLYAQEESKAKQAADLLMQKKDLENLLKLSPCDAQKLYQGATVEPQRQIEEPVQKPEAAAPVIKQPPVQQAAKEVDQIEAACVFVISLKDANHVATGSGFFIAPNYVLTNKHVVGSPKSKILVTNKALGKPVIAFPVAQSNGTTGDYALLEVALPQSSAPATLKLAKDVQKTEKVGAWGYPTLIGKADPQYAKLLMAEDFNAIPELSYSEGVVSAILNRNPQLIVHTAPISPGNSGGPLVNSNGEVVGINTMISLDEKSYRQASIVLSATDLKNFLEQYGLRP